MRVVAVFEALMMATAIIDRYQPLRRACTRSLRDANRALGEQIALQTRLTELDGRHQTAFRRGNRRLAEAAHDLRQPIHAVRMTIEATDGAADRRDAIERSFAYLEGLVAEQLETAPKAPAPARADAVLSNLREMFGADADARGMDLPVMPCSAPLHGDPLQIMQILSNLVSNAVQYTRTRRIIVGARRIPGGLRFDVHDQGPGLSAEDLARAPGARLLAHSDDPGGHGLSLGMVDELTRKNRLTLAHRPREARASFTPRIPAS
jgi:signal transduction histidine kinase